MKPHLEDADLRRLVIGLYEKVDELSTRLDTTLETMSMMVQWSQKLMDRMIELQLAKSGDSEAALKHRAMADRKAGTPHSPHSNETEREEETSIWNDFDPRDEPWPPPGYTAVNLKG